MFDGHCTQPVHIWKQSAQNNPLAGLNSMHESDRTILLIKSNLSSNSNTSNSDPTSAILNEQETLFESRKERDPDAYRSVCPHKIFESQPGNLG